MRVVGPVATSEITRQSYRTPITGSTSKQADLPKTLWNILSFNLVTTYIISIES